jgi:hypothetical protein
MWLIQVVGLHFMLAADGDERARRLDFIVAELHRLKDENQLPAAYESWLSQAEPAIVKMRWHRYGRHAPGRLRRSW